MQGSGDMSFSSRERVHTPFRTSKSQPQHKATTGIIFLLVSKGVTRVEDGREPGVFSHHVQPCREARVRLKTRLLRNEE